MDKINAAKEAKVEEDQKNLDDLQKQLDGLNQELKDLKGDEKVE